MVNHAQASRKTKGFAPAVDLSIVPSRPSPHTPGKAPPAGSHATSQMAAKPHGCWVFTGFLIRQRCLHGLRPPPPPPGLPTPPHPRAPEPLVYLPHTHASLPPPQYSPAAPTYPEGSTNALRSAGNPGPVPAEVFICTIHRTCDAKGNANAMQNA